MAPILELRELVKHYPGHKAVDGVSLSIPQGSFFALVGPSGCGKTTTLRMIAGLETPTSGEVWLNGRPINHLKPYQRSVNTVFQNYALFPHMTVAANIEFGLRRKGASELARRLREVLELVQLAGKESRYPAELSGGERQRVALARSLVVAPDVLLLDEPLSALDPKLRKQVRAELKALQRQVGITFLLVTHDQEESLSLSDRIAVMNQGRVEQVGTPEALYLEPRSRFVASFLGAMNWLGEAGVRPEALRLSRETPPAGTRTMRGVVERTLFLGNALEVHVRADRAAHTAVALVPRSSEPFEPGAAVHLWWNATDEVRFPEPHT